MAKHDKSPVPGVNIGEPASVHKPAMPKDYIKGGNPNDPNAMAGRQQAGNASILDGSIKDPARTVQTNPTPLGAPKTGTQPTDAVRPPQNPLILIDEDDLFDYLYGEVPTNSALMGPKRR
jgi:hypothetical protein